MCILLCSLCVLKAFSACARKFRVENNSTENCDAKLYAGKCEWILLIFSVSKSLLEVMKICWSSCKKPFRQNDYFRLCQVYMVKASIFCLEPVFRKALSSLASAGVKINKMICLMQDRLVLNSVKNWLSMLFQTLCTLNTHTGKPAIPLYINRLPLQAKQMI